MKSNDRSIRACMTLWLALTAAAFSIPGHSTPGQPGTLDTTFAADSPLGGGKFMASLGASHAWATGIAVQPDGKLLLSGTCGANLPYDTCVMRIHSDGSIDTSFGTAGRVGVAVSSSESYSILLQPDGKFVLAGSCYNGSWLLCAARFQANGSLDTSFGSLGRAGTLVGRSPNGQRAAALQPDGKIVIAGFCEGASNTDFCMVRYNSLGALDLSFGANGTVVTSVAAGTDRANALVVQPDGKLMLAGYCSPLADFSDASLYDSCAVRYNADGSVDTSFGSGGKLIAPADGLEDRAKAIALQPDGKIVLAGFCNSQLCLSRYDKNGSPDPIFGSNGKVLTNFGSGSDWGPAVVVQPDGKLVIAGKCFVSFKTVFCAQRYFDNGTLDVSFGTSGSVTTTVADVDDRPYALALQNDGKLVVVGSCIADGLVQFCAVRYDGGPFGYKNCSMDIDGDNRVLATTDSLIHTRIALGITGPAVVGGITFAPNATRNTWPLIREFLVTQCGMSLVQ